jgi:hypothetical protein
MTMDDPPAHRGLLVLQAVGMFSHKAIMICFIIVSLPFSAMAVIPIRMTEGSP